MQKNVLRWFSITAALPFLLTACQFFPAEEELPAAPIIRSYEAEEYAQTVVLRGDLFLNKKIQCEYMPTKEDRLSFSLGGEYIDRIYVVKGQQVQAGELLAELVQDDLPEQIVSQEYEIQVLEARKSHLIENLELELSLLKYQEASVIRINDTKEQYQKQMQEIEDSLYIQKLRLEELKTELKNRQICAGMDGTVTSVRTVEAGQRSVEGRTMITVADMDTTAFTVKGDDAKYFPVGTEVVITFNGKEYAAVSVEATDLGLPEPVEGATAIAYLRLDQPDPTLEAGNRGMIEITLEARYDVLYLNKKAIKTADNKNFVYVLDENGLKVMQDVTVGLISGGFAEIVSGLAEGDSVIIE